MQTAEIRCTGLPYELKPGNELVIGSDERRALVEIAGAEGVHAVVRYVRDGFKEGRWWIENQAASGTLLNGEPLTSAPLSNGDCISIAGFELLFSNGCLREDHRRAKGVRVDVQAMSDARGGRTILRSVSFVAREGEFVGILGPSGCGKSSVIQRLAGLAGFKSGRITINGHPVSANDKTLRRLIAYLPQSVEDSLHGSLTPRAEMACARRIFLAPGADDADLDAATLGMLGLSDVAGSLIGKLSGGQKRRVAIALALLRQPQLLLLDEPTAGLDPATETEVMESLRRLSRQGRTVICATHVMENIALFDKVLVLSGGEGDNGRPVYFGPPDGVLAHFDAPSYPAMYARLKAGACGDAAVSAEDAAPDPWDLPEPPAQASFGRSVGGYLRRSWAKLCAQIVHPKSVLDHVVPASVRALLVQPLLIALGIKLACADMFAESATMLGGGLSTILFCAVLAVFWIGLAGNVQGLVGERIPGRCLERLGGVSLARYGVAKLVVLLGPCLVQTLVFSILLFRLPAFGATSSSLLVASPVICSKVYIVLSLVCLMGGLVGMAVSALARQAVAAVGAIPVIAVLALFFSQPVIGFDMSRSNEPGLLSVRIAEWMPCYRPQVYLCVIEGQDVVNTDEKPKTPWRFLGLFAVYAGVAAGLAALAQRQRERAWDGR